VAGRLHLDAYLGHRYQDYLNVSPFRLGGNNRLRGYPASHFDGKNLIAANAEFRTPGVDILSAQVGLAAFYDLGAASDEIRSAAFYQGTGAGVRILFPQAERTVMRLDWGLPVSGDRDVLPGAFFFTFGQAFFMPDSSGGGDPL
jgi:outer membrane protein assembly factor BamA